MGNSKLFHSTSSLASVGQNQQANFHNAMRAKLSENLQQIFHPNMASPPHQSHMSPHHQSHINLAGQFNRQSSAPLQLVQKIKGGEKGMPNVLTKSATTGSMKTKMPFLNGFGIVTAVSVEQYQKFRAKNKDKRARRLMRKARYFKKNFTDKKQFYKTLLSEMITRQYNFYLLKTEMVHVIPKSISENRRLVTEIRKLYQNKLNNWKKKLCSKKEIVPKKRIGRTKRNPRFFSRQNSHEESQSSATSLSGKCQSLDNIFVEQLKARQHEPSKQILGIQIRQQVMGPGSRQQSPVHLSPYQQTSSHSNIPYRTLKPSPAFSDSQYGGSCGNLFDQVNRKGSFDIPKAHNLPTYHNTIIGFESIKPRLITSGFKSPRSYSGEDPEFFSKLQDEYEELRVMNDDGFLDMEQNENCGEFEEDGSTDEDGYKIDFRSESLVSSDIETHGKHSDDFLYPYLPYTPKARCHTIDSSCEEEMRILSNASSSSSKESPDMKNLNRRKKSKKVMSKSMSTFNKNLLKKDTGLDTNQRRRQSVYKLSKDTSNQNFNITHPPPHLLRQLSSKTVSPDLTRPRIQVDRQSSLIKNKQKKKKFEVRDILNQDLNTFETEGRTKRSQSYVMRRDFSREDEDRRQFKYSSNTVPHSRTVSPLSTHSPQYMTRSNTPTNFYHNSTNVLNSQKFNQWPNNTFKQQTHVPRYQLMAQKPPPIPLRTNHLPYHQQAHQPAQMQYNVPIRGGMGSFAESTGTWQKMSVRTDAKFILSVRTSTGV